MLCFCPIRLFALGTGRDDTTGLALFERFDNHVYDACHCCDTVGFGIGGRWLKLGFQCRDFSFEGIDCFAVMDSSFGEGRDVGLNGGTSNSQFREGSSILFILSDSFAKICFEAYLKLIQVRSAAGFFFQSIVLSVSSACFLKLVIANRITRPYEIVR